MIKIRKSLFIVSSAALLTIILASCTSHEGNIADKSFNAGWLFSKGDLENAQLADYDDSDWRSLDLPHDWAIEGPFSDENNARTGGLPIAGTAWYRKHFDVSRAMEGKRVSVEFDGAMYDAHVWVNGEFVGNRPYGYISFEFDITNFVNFGEENVIAVRLNPEYLAMRWYPGAGIYRDVRIKYNDPLHIPQWGTFITTPKVSDEDASIHISTNIRNEGKTEVKARLRTKIFDPDGSLVEEASSTLSIKNKETGKVEQDIIIKNPSRWDLDTPNLYSAVSEVIVGSNVVDKYTTEFGIRTIEFTKNDGFLLNGRRVDLQGVCMHHDLGPLGTAFNYRARERQMEIMKRMGANALRTSHNPPSPEWLKICDHMGILVLVEAFDEWQIAKVEKGYHQFFDEWHERDLRDMIRRDRNHPSVIMWSIGNEILEQNRKDGWKITKRLSDICHEEDQTRPTTAGFNYYPAPFNNKLAFQIDVVGMNYWPLEYPEIKKNYPDLIIYGSETASQASSRGVYHLPLEAQEQHETNHVSSYDMVVGPPWSYAPDVEFDAQAAEPASLGEFTWTGIDYLGEPTPYGGRDNSTNGFWNADWPSRSSYFAPVDLCGFPKDRFYLYQSQWTAEPMVHLLPHWNWEGREGELIPVVAYTNCDEAELFVNGKSFGKKVKGEDLVSIPAYFHSWNKDTYESKYRLLWEVPYEAGSIKVVAYKNGEALAEQKINTAGVPSRISIEADRSIIKADGNDLSFITVRIEDEDGNLCPNAANLVEFEITGVGEIAGVCNGDQTDLSSFQEPRQTAFSGMCLAIVKSAETGDILFSASSEGLTGDEINIQSTRNKEK